jgi:hypothetical protein
MTMIKERKKKKITLEDLAAIIAKGFAKFGEKLDNPHFRKKQGFQK